MNATDRSFWHVGCDVRVDRINKRLTYMETHQEIIMKTSQWKQFAIVLFAVPLAFTAFRTTATPVAAGSFDDAAAIYKAKCAACHGVAAAKWFDPAGSDEAHVEAILKGKKGEKPPYMPEFSSKGISEAVAKDLVAHMRSIRQP